jgi:hypothetical protein
LNKVKIEYIKLWKRAWMNLEERVTRGFIVYIHSIDYDVVNKSLVIKLLKNPEEQ